MPPPGPAGPLPEHSRQGIREGISPRVEVVTPSCEAQPRERPLLGTTPTRASRARGVPGRTAILLRVTLFLPRRGPRRLLDGDVPHRRRPCGWPRSPSSRSMPPAVEGQPPRRRRRLLLCLGTLASRLPERCARHRHHQVRRPVSLGSLRHRRRGAGPATPFILPVWLSVLRFAIPSRLAGSALGLVRCGLRRRSSGRPRAPSPLEPVPSRSAEALAAALDASGSLGEGAGRLLEELER